VMSTLSPTLTAATAFLSSTRELYFQLFGPEKVIDGVFRSISVIVAVMVRCVAAVAPGFHACGGCNTRCVTVHRSFARMLHAKHDVVVVLRVILSPPMISENLSSVSGKTTSE
jgi:hypothetical protein